MDRAEARDENQEPITPSMWPGEFWMRLKTHTDISHDWVREKKQEEG